MANGSAPMSTRRKSTIWRYSSLGPKRSIACSTLRASLRARRPERAELSKPLDDLRRDLALTVDAVRVRSLAQEPLELVEEGLRPLSFLGRLIRIRMNQFEPQPAEEEVAHEARCRPLLLTRGLRDFPRLVGGDRWFVVDDVDQGCRLVIAAVTRLVVRSVDIIARPERLRRCPRR